MTKELELSDVIDGELVDETCKCGRLGRFVNDPYDQDVNDCVTKVVLCDDCHADLCMEI